MASTINLNGNSKRIDDTTLKISVEKYGTPLFIYDLNMIREQYNKLREALPETIKIFYSIKANPSLAICYEIKELGANAELSSLYEIKAALNAGFHPKQIIFVGPAKSEKEIESAILLDIYAIVCESMNELELITKKAKKHGKIVPVALRINPSHVEKTAQLKMGGVPSQFGIDEILVMKNMKIFIENKNIKLMGIHIYNGTRNLRAKDIVDNTENILTIATNLQKKFNVRFPMVDIGGGFGVPYFEGEKELDLISVADGLKTLITNYLLMFPETKIILESGRYLVAGAGILVCKVIDVKVSKGVKYVIVDGGTNCEMAVIGMGSIVKRNFPISVINMENKSSELESCNIAGPLCTPGDLLAKNIELPKISIGDLILVKNVGAYGPTASPVMFLSHGFPVEILYKNQRTYIIRDRYNEEDFMRHQYIIK